MKIRDLIRTATWALLLCVLLGATLAYGQGGRATVTGTVYDASGAVIPGADVQLVLQATGTTRATVADDRGFFTFVGIAPGTYDLLVSAKSFQPLKKQNIILHINDQIDLRDVVMKVAGSSSTVEVSSTSTNITPISSGEKSYTISSEQVQNLSIVGRNSVELLKIIPGAQNSGGWNGTYNGEVSSFNNGVGAYTVNGTRFDQLAVVSDGGGTIDPGCMCGSVVTPNVAFIQEAKVETSSFSAENPNGPIVISTQTKSGTKTFHGEAYYNIRDSVMNANDWQNNHLGVARPDSRFQYPGFSIGGPVIIPGTDFNKNRDKLFFFGGFEWMRQNVDLGLKKSIVPTDAMRTGDFSDTAYLASLAGNATFAKNPICQGGTLPAYCSSAGHLGAIDPGGQILMNLYPHANADPTRTGGYNYLENVVNPQPRAQQLVKLDYDASVSTHFSVRYNHEGETLPYPYGLWQTWPTVTYPGNVVGKNWAHSIAANLTNVISPTFTNQATVSLSYLNYKNTVSNFNAMSASALNYPYQGVYDNGIGLLPNIDGNGGIASIDNRGGLVPGLTAPKWTLTIADNVSKAIGTHLLKFGIYYDRLTSYQQTTSLDQGGVTLADWGTLTGNGYADLLAGHIAMWTQSTKNVVADMASNRFDGFAQDTWKVSKRLTLNFGARVGHIGWWYDRNGNITVFDPAAYQKAVDAGATLADYPGLLTHARNSSTPTSGFSPTGVQFSPNVGVAWDLTGSGKTVIRGGFGMNYFREEAVNSANLVQNPPLLTTGYFAPSGGLQLSAVSSQTTGLVNYLSTANKNDDQLPRTFSYNLTVARQLPYSTNLEAAYVGSHSSKLVGWPNINAVPEGAESGIGWPGSWNDPGYRPYSLYGAGIWATSHVLSSNYNSLQVTANRQTGKINYWISYTFSKSLGTNTANPFDVNRYYGPLPFDRTHSLRIAYNMALPEFGKKYLGNHKVVNGITDGWQFSGVTDFTSGGPLYFVADLPGSSGIYMNGVNNVAWGQLGSRFIVGTPDENSVPLIVCDPTANLGPQQVFNASCFQSPTRGNNGTYRPPYIRGPWYNNSDLSIFKNFKVAESRTLQIRAEAFNFLNHPLWTFAQNDPALTLQYSNYGALPDNATKSGAQAAGIPQAGVMSVKSGRRIVQLAVKFTF